MTSGARKNLISLSGIVIAIALGYGLSEVLGASSKTTIGNFSLTSVCILAAFIVQWLSSSQRLYSKLNATLI